MTEHICLGEICRPGGFKITDRALSFCRFPPGAHLADLGCGSGLTVEYLRRKYHLAAWGIEKDQVAAKSQGRDYVLVGNAMRLPFDQGELDGVLLECSLSKMEAPARVLKECARVLKHRGYLIISDLYAQGKRGELSGLLGQVEDKETLFRALTEQGFKVKLFEDYSQDLHAMWGQLIFRYGLKALCHNLGADKETLQQIKCGYCLIVARKEASF
jgi:arsenite methyltransferase